MTTPPDAPSSRTERLFARIAILQAGLTVIALVVSGIAMYAALVEANASRRQTQASVWPHVDAGYGVFDGEGAFFVANRGIGPARIRSALLAVDGEPATDWRTAIATLYGDARPPTWSYIDVVPRVLDPGDLLPIMSISNGLEARDFRSSGKSDRLRFELCYCSVFDECWLQHHPEKGDPEPVKACPNYGENAFRD